MSTDISIIPIDIEKDIQTLENLITLTFSSTPDANTTEWFSMDEMVSSIRLGKGHCLKAINNLGEIIGMIHAQIENPINGREGKEKWVITNISISPQETGKGIGGKLLEAIEIIGKEKGAIKMYVHTNIDDEKVIHFYKKNNYEFAGTIKDYYYEGSAIFLIKYLNK
ncbi:hypothetical protein BH09PAT2_BH09PAT2_05400 [soil metagenome]